jgi:hypothetical protein
VARKEKSVLLWNKAFTLSALYDRRMNKTVSKADRRILPEKLRNLKAVKELSITRIDQIKITGLLKLIKSNVINKHFRHHKFNPLVVKIVPVLDCAKMRLPLDLVG